MTQAIGESMVAGDGDRLLLVDDTPTNLQVLYQTLDGRGHELLIAQNGEEALTLAREARPSLILLDIMMPGIDGFETCRRLKDDPDTQEAAVIFMSALDETKDKVKGLELGAVDYITKPFQAEEVIARVNTHLTIRRLNRQLAASNRRMKQDLDAAAKVQHALLPQTPPSVTGSRFAWTYRPCDELAGDSLNVFAFDDRHVGLYVVDVSGHGVPAALLAVSVTHNLVHRSGDSSSLVVAAGEGEDAITSPGWVATRLNELYPMAAQANKYFTLVYGVLDTHTGRFRYVCAGHPGPIRVRPGEPAAVFDQPDFPVGIVGGHQFEESVIELQPGDRLYMHSDGILEEFNGEQVQFGRDRLHAVLDDAAAEPLDRSTAAVVDALTAWRGDDRFTDDVTILAVEHVG